MIFELDNVELYFKSKRILNGIYLKAETGKVTALLGRNGCGKTSLMAIAFGNLKPKYKLVRLDSKPILKPLYSTGLVKYLPQYNFLPNGMKLQNVFKIFKVEWRTFAEEFESFSKYEFFKMKQLSGGERRLVETYIVLKAESKMVILDEPFSHLAPLHIETIKHLIAEEKTYKAIIISDHMYRHIIDTADSIYLLQNGTTKKIDELTELEDYKYLSIGSLD